MQQLELCIYCIIYYVYTVNPHFAIFLIKKNKNKLIDNIILRYNYNKLIDLDNYSVQSQQE